MAGLKLLMRPSGLLIPISELGVEQLPESQLLLGEDIPYGISLLMGHDGLQPRLLQVDANRALKVTTAGSAVAGPVRIQGGTSVRLLTMVSESGDGSSGDDIINTGLRLFDGVGSWQRGRAASAAALAALSGLGGQLVAPPGQWSLTSAPATGNQATATRAAGGAGVRHICTGYGFGFSASVAPVATTFLITLRDGASGAGTVLKSWSFDIPAAVIPPFAIEVSGVEIVGSAATAMTMEFAGGLANFRGFVNLAGHDAS